jgi:hypothetical protein
MADERIIHIEWSGPHSLAEVDAFRDRRRDRGLYQIYGHHPVYGPNVLLYIGQTDLTFGERIPGENWGGGSIEDPQNVEVYVGRLKGPATPSRDEWRREICLAERLLIHAHGPAYNSTNIMAVAQRDQEARKTRVLNWGCFRSLHREVSGLLWIQYQQFTEYKIYEASTE